MSNSDAEKALEKLHARLVDTRRGYDEGIDRAETPDVAAFFGHFAKLRDEHIGELGRWLAAKGMEPQYDGGWMTMVHTSIMKVRDAFGTLDDSVKDDVIKGEKALLDLYDDTIEKLSASEAMGGIVTRQRDELNRAIDRMEA